MKLRKKREEVGLGKIKRKRNWWTKSHRKGSSICQDRELEAAEFKGGAKSDHRCIRRGSLTLEERRTRI